MAYKGKFIPKNKHKYNGDWSKIIYRSSWELKFMRYADTNASILRWSSEEVVIPYICATDHRQHRYYMDFWIRVKSKDGSIKDKLIEVKPYNQTIKPKYKKGTSKKNFYKRMYSYIKNRSKWHYAEEYAKQRGMDFHILTENELNIGLKKR